MAPPSSAPPSLPPSVEEAYRRKCVQLRNRTNEVEDNNDAARLRLARIKRQVEKLRIERAFLLEQLSKRTSANVEDSEGSPSPPPTPKDKPLRIKRGHRKSVLTDIDSKATTKNSLKEPASPSKGDDARGIPVNGVGKKAKAAKTAFEQFCLENRAALEERIKEDDADVDIDEELLRAWEDLPAGDKEEYNIKPDEDVKGNNEKEDKGNEDETPEKEDSKSAAKADMQDEDVEMTNYDSDDQDQDRETQVSRDVTR